MNDLSLTFTCQVIQFPSQLAQRRPHGVAVSDAKSAPGNSPNHRPDTAQRFPFGSDVWPFEPVGEVAVRILSKILAGGS
jgi:hypothetical protein